MPEKIKWSAESVRIIQKMRHDGKSYDAVALVLRVSRTALIEECKRRGIVRKIPVPPVSREVLPLADPERPPYAPGHPVTWGLLTRGTLLEHEPYPWPVPGTPLPASE